MTKSTKTENNNNKDIKRGPKFRAKQTLPKDYKSTQNHCFQIITISVSVWGILFEFLEQGSGNQGFQVQFITHHSVIFLIIFGFYAV